MLRAAQLLLLFVWTPVVAVGDDAESIPYDPAWGSVAPRKVIVHKVPDGRALVKAIAALKPGDRLEIAAGTYVVDQFWNIQVSGTKEAPIWIVAQEGAAVVLTRSDAEQNVLNIGQSELVEYLCIKGIEITGGSHGLRLGQCQDLWIDRCHIHHTGDVCLSANMANTARLHLTRNHLHHGAGHGEGMYLGSHDGQFVMSQSVIALNHVHDCGGEQGDGIEIKQGSWGNRIVQNRIHDTNYPCITVYGTNGNPVNVIERNLCYRSNNFAMQVQGEAIVRNNVLIAGKDACFASTDHQSKSVNLQVIHNTMVNIGHAFYANSWRDREGMILANNVLYSRDGNAISFVNGSAGATIVGNVVVGAGERFQSERGRGLEDFENVSWDGKRIDVTPRPDAPFLRAAPEHLTQEDFLGKARTGDMSGAVMR